tara:strand:- start:15706 stop:15978 length:273 start_codon:yes stop_codon:yes gene_type:complete
MKNSELIKGMYVKQGDVDWVKQRLEFDVKQFSQMLIDYKDVFEANKGKGRIDICLSKGNKLYATLSTFKPVKQNTMNEHLAEREEENIPF